MRENFLIFVSISNVVLITLHFFGNSNMMTVNLYSVHWDLLVPYYEFEICTLCYLSREFTLSITIDELSNLSHAIYTIFVTILLSDAMYRTLAVDSYLLTLGGRLGCRNNARGDSQFWCARYLSFYHIRWYSFTNFNCLTQLILYEGRLEIWACRVFIVRALFSRFKVGLLWSNLMPKLTKQRCGGF